MKAKLAALDIDGTLLTNDKRLTPRTAAAVGNLEDRGIIGLLVTGRPMSGIPQELLSLRGMRYIITSNGAVTTDLREGKILRQAALDAETAQEITRIPLERGLIHSVFIDGTGYCEPRFMEQQLAFFGGTPLESYVRRSRKSTGDILKKIRDSVSGVENIWFIAHDREERDELDAYIRSRWNVRTSLTAKRDVEVGHHFADKGMALRELADKLGIAKEEIIAIGDNENDLGMLESAGTAVAMGNAQESVKRIAAVITDSNEEDGAAKILEVL